MKNDRDIVDVIRSIASGSSVDWDSAGATPADASTKSVLEELRVIARIAEVHGVSRTDAAAVDDGVEGRLQSWGPLTVLEPIGRGAYGDVYRAWDSRLDRDVALKLLRHTARTSDADAPVIEEGRLLARVRHPNVVTVHGADRIDGRIGIWMEFVEGETLDQIVGRDGPMTPSQVVTIGMEVCRGVAAVHQAGLVHRDIKAQNVMRQADGRIVLMDFGTGRASDATHTKSITGTPLYLAPEVLVGEAASPSSDIYSVGVLLYYLLTGSFPVAGRTLDDVRHAHRAGSAAATRRARPSVPRRLASIIDRAIDPVPALRFPDASTMERELRACQSAPRRYALAAAAAAVLVATVLGGWIVDRAGSRRGGNQSQAAGMRMRQIDWPVSWFLLGAPSPDGRLLSYTDARTGNLAVLNTASGATRLITNDADWGKNRYATSSVFSVDNRQLAYSWYRAGDGAELRLIDADGSHGRALVVDDAVDDFGLLDWSHDGKALLVRVESRDRSTRLEVVSPDDAVRRVLKPSWPVVTAPRASFSPDDRFVVYDEPASPANPRDLRILDVASGHDEPLLTGSADDAEPIWAGSQVLFTSNRGGKRALWRVPMSDGRAAGEPAPVNDQLAIGFWPVGLTAAGSLYYAAAEGVSSVYTAEFTASGDVTTPARVTTSTDPELWPEWSPDGRSVAWVARSRASRPGAVLRVRDLATGHDRTLTTPFTPGANIRWSPDGTRLLVRGPDDKGDALRLVDAATGQLMRSYLAGRQFGDVEWSADGTGAFFMDFKQRLIGRLDIASGGERTIYRLAGATEFNRGIAVAPHGTTIAFHVYDGDISSIVAIPAAGGRAKTLLTVRPQHRVALQEWTSDGRQLLFARSRSMPGTASTQEWQLWSVDVQGGETHYLDLSMPNLGSLRVNAAGRRLVFTSSNSQNSLRVLDNVLAASQ